MWVFKLSKLYTHTLTLRLCDLCGLGTIVDCIQQELVGRRGRGQVEILHTCVIHPHTRFAGAAAEVQQEKIPRVE